MNDFQQDRPEGLGGASAEISGAGDNRGGWLRRLLWTRTDTSRKNKGPAGARIPRGQNQNRNKERLGQKMGNCNTCPLYVAAEKFAMTSTPRSARPSRSIWNDDTFTPFGRLVAAAAMTARLKTRQDLSSLLGYSRSNSNFGDVMRGKSGVSGPVLSSLWSFCTSNGYTHSYNDFAGAYRSSLLPIEKKTGRTRRSSTANQSDAGQLPFQPGPCAVDARTAS